MRCTVHCLVSTEEELGPLRARIAQAGIADERVHVVWRPGSAHARAQELLEAWCRFLAPGSVWWAQALGDQAHAGKPR